MVDKEQASREFARARTLADALPEPSRTLMTYVNNRDVAHLGPILEPHLTALGGDPALSPDHGARARVSGVSPARDGRQRHPGDRVSPAGADAAGPRCRRPLSRNAAGHPRRGRPLGARVLRVGAGPLLECGAGRLADTGRLRRRRAWHGRACAGPAPACRLSAATSSATARGNRPAAAARRRSARSHTRRRRDHRMADRFAHLPHLPVAPFVDHDRQQRLDAPARRLDDLGDAARRPAPSGGRRSRRRARSARSRGRPARRARAPRTRARRRGSDASAAPQVAVAGQDQQAFRLVVQPADRIDVVADAVARQDVDHRRTMLRIRRGS